jgi:hypothetical protein
MVYSLSREAVLALIAAYWWGNTVAWTLVPLPPTTTSRTRYCIDRSTLLFGASSSSSSEFSILDEDGQQQANDNEAERLREQARKLRKEIEEFESQKEAMEQTEREKMQAELDSRKAVIERYSVVVPILKPDGTTVEEKIQFPPRLEELSEGASGSSTILLCEAALPLGILLGEHETLVGMTEVDEVAPGSNGEKAGIQEGDLLRACTACKMEMVREKYVE